MMDQLWQIWWVWMGGAILLVILEVFLPGFILLGFAIGAAMTGLLIVAGFLSTLPVTLFVFAVLSLVAWFVLRKVFATRFSQPQTFDRDIND